MKQAVSQRCSIKRGTIKKLFKIHRLIQEAMSCQKKYLKTLFKNCKRDMTNTSTKRSLDELIIKAMRAIRKSEKHPDETRKRKNYL